jgi:putative DNA primase/helicase
VSAHATSVREGLEVFFAPGSDLIEVRILKTSKGTVSGYFDGLDPAVRAVETAITTYTNRGNYYATINPVIPAVQARAVNRLKPFADRTTADAEILRRAYFLIDVDPVRPAGVSSTDGELAEALSVRDEIMAFLSARGWPEGLRGMSGNGGHGLYRIDLPNDAPSRDLVNACLAVLADRFTTPKVTIDRAVFNAARISKIYGTTARKGDPTPDRPHRRAVIEARPILQVVTLAQLQALAGQPSAPPPPRRTPSTHGRQNGASTGGVRLDMGAEFEQRGWYLRALPGGKHAVRCPWIDAHSGISGDTETVLFEPDRPDGLWGFKCQHEHCLGRTIRDVWELFRPTGTHARDRGTRTRRAAAAAPAAAPRTGDAPAADPEEIVGPIPLGEVDPETGRLVLSPRRTRPTAIAYVRAFYQHARGQLLYDYAGVLLAWQDNHYRELEEAALTCHLQDWLHRALRYVIVDRRTRAMGLTDFESNPQTIKQALDSIRAYTHLSATTEAPSWLDPEPHPPALEILPCRSRNVHLPTRTVLPATPAFFTTTALDFDFDPQAPAPRQWLAFLADLWGDDEELIALLQEWCGYCLSADTSQHKMLLLVGPRRSGKGTIGRILTRLVGVDHVVGPTTASLAGDFGLQPLIGKSLAIVSDARFSGPAISSIVERLLCISGEDRLTIDRKFLGAVTLKLPTRFMFLTNELPRFTDASIALAGRFLVLRLTRSFYGEEDPTLTARLSTELPGILLWAIAGWSRLHTRGMFVQSATGMDAIQDLEDLASPVRPFLRDFCTLHAELRVPVDTLYSAWELWCHENGRKPGTKQSFGRDLVSAAPQVIRRRTSGFAAFYEGLNITADTADALDRWLKARHRGAGGPL